VGSTQNHTKALANLGPRGPDATEQMFLVTDNNIPVSVGFTRLQIQGSVSGAEQPFRLADGSLVMCNGEIFNSMALIQNLGLPVSKEASDCAVIPALLARGLSLAEVARQLDGDFAILVLDLKRSRIEVARDPYGVRPLYYGFSEDGPICFASEIKGLDASCTTIRSVEPGTVLGLDLNGSTNSQRWHQIPWLKAPYSEPVLRQVLEDAVQKRLTTMRELGACLSGGLDSSLVAALATKLLGHPIHTYSIGMEGSPDLAAARLVAAHIGSIHHERIVTAAECLAAIPTVIKAIESYDITTVRASVGNYLLGEFIAKETPNVKVVLNGDGADEALGGYLYMRAAPDDVAFESETDRLLTEIHCYDVLRSERSMAAHGLESRSPFLDRQFISVARSIPTELLRPTKNRMEKHVLRSAFASSGLLPEAVLWRRKEAFSDGISRTENSWFAMAAAEGEKAATLSATAYDVNPPPTAEARWYRQLFHEHYSAAAAATIPAMWMPRFIEGATDPSARTLNLYTE